MRTIIRAIRLGAIGLSLVYWAWMLVAIVTHLVSGGPESVVRFYWYIADLHNEITPAKWNWAPFLVAQGVYLAITLALILFEWRARRHPAGTAQ